VSDTLTPIESMPPSDDDRGARTGRTRVAPFIALALALVIGALFVVLAGSDPASNETVDSFLKGQPAPRAVNTTLDGQQFDLSRRKGSWVVLNFFDPQCVPCVDEHPQLIAFQQQQTALVDGAELYTITNGGRDQDEIRDFFTANGGEWPVVDDPDGSISVAFGVSQVPETWIVDPEGIVRERFAGEVTADFLSTLIQQYRELRG
jgi:cytochrome c biogenesis protein CcmG/thiol:disulfide interchange protein DsbE